MKKSKNKIKVGAELIRISLTVSKIITIKKTRWFVKEIVYSTSLTDTISHIIVRSAEQNYQTSFSMTDHMSPKVILQGHAEAWSSIDKEKKLVKMLKKSLHERITQNFNNLAIQKRLLEESMKDGTH